MDERDRVAVVGPDRDRQSTAGDRARERDNACPRRAYGRTRGAADVDAAMLPARIRVVAELEASQHRTRSRPRPRTCGGSENECRDGRGEGRSQRRQHALG